MRCKECGRKDCCGSDMVATEDLYPIKTRLEGL